MKVTNMIKWNYRQHKQYTRGLATSFSPRKFPLLLPAGDALCLQEAEKKGMVDKSFSRPILVERDKKVVQDLRKTLTKINWDEKSLVHEGELHELEISCPIDYAWIDLCGTISKPLAYWINYELSPNLLPGAVICLTHEYCWRNNKWLKETRESILKNHNLSYVDFRFDNSVIEGDKYIAYPGFLMKCLLRNWSITMMKPIRYFDTIDMMFYRFVIVEHQPNPIFPIIDMGKINLFSQGVTMKTVPTSGEVINAILNAKKPAEKSHATRKLNAYVASRVKEGFDEKRVVAAINAHVTRRS